MPICLASAASIAARSRGGRGADAGGTGAQASNTLYCWKDRLVDEQGKLVCNWASTRYDACHGRETSYLEKRLVTTQPSAATRCENGQSLVYVTTG